MRIGFSLPLSKSSSTKAAIAADTEILAHRQKYQSHSGVATGGSQNADIQYTPTAEETNIRALSRHFNVPSSLFSESKNVSIQT